MRHGKSLVLIVEDDEDISLALRDLLIEDGYDVETARDGDDALALLRAGLDPECVILDLMMPRLSGVDLLAILHGDPALSRLEVLVCSASTRLTAELNIPYIRKPFQLDEMMSSIEAAVNRSRAKSQSVAS